MIHCNRQMFGRVWLPLASLAVFAAGCGESDQLSPSVEAPAATTPATTDSAGALPADSTTSVDSTLLSPDSLAGTDSAGVVTASTLAAGTQPGIVFGSYGIMPSNMSS